MWCSDVLAVLFLSAFISKYILIHQEVYSTTELINRVFFVLTDVFFIFFGQPW